VRSEHSHSQSCHCEKVRRKLIQAETFALGCGFKQRRREKPIRKATRVATLMPITSANAHNLLRLRVCATGKTSVSRQHLNVRTHNIHVYFTPGNEMRVRLRERERVSVRDDEPSRLFSSNQWSTQRMCFGNSLT